jgi:ketosteroid isomerase-like protein
MTAAPEPSAAQLLTRLAAAVDAEDWSVLRALLADDAVVRYEHTGEELDATAYVALNRDYPGRWRFEPQEVVDGGDRAVLRARVSDGAETHAVVVLASVLGGRLVDLVEVWAEVGVQPGSGRRPDLG